MTDDVLLNYKEAADFLKCSKRTLERWVTTRRVPSFRGPGGRTFSKKALLAWVDAQVSSAAKRSRKLEVVA